jgi:hypothetical protein
MREWEVGFAREKATYTRPKYKDIVTKGHRSQRDFLRPPVGPLAHLQLTLWASRVRRRLQRIDLLLEQAVKG